MNDEIKEILVLQNYVNRYKSDEKAIINHSILTTPLMLDYLEVKNLLDYITNLQQENERLKTIKPCMLNFQECYVVKDYKSRCEKAIEYIKENRLDFDEFIIFASPKYLLNILQNGEDSQ